jgi:hypothetical protein
MNSQVSRRAFLAASGGLVALASGAIFWRSGTSRPRARRVAGPPVADGYVDHNGWMLTTADKKRVIEQQLVAPPAP